jgi:toxin CcdB
MNQFDVHRVLGKRQDAAPFLVVVQSRRLAGLATRVVIPLIPQRTGDFDPDLAPACEIEGRRYCLAPWQIFTIPTARLGPVVASLAGDNESAAIVRAIDALISQAWH